MVTKALALVVLALVLILVTASGSADEKDTSLKEHRAEQRVESYFKSPTEDSLSEGYEGPEIFIRPVTQEIPEVTAGGSARSPLHQGTLTAPSCWHRASSALGVCRLHRECYPLLRLPNLSPKDGWAFGIYDSCPLYHDGALVFGICCAKDTGVSPASPQHTNDVVVAAGVQQVDKYMFVEGAGQHEGEDESPGLMDRSHVQFVPPRSLSLSRRPAVPWLPQSPTHPPSHTDKPWWTRAETTTTTTTTANPWWTDTTTKSWWAPTPSTTLRSEWSPSPSWTTSTTTPRPASSTTTSPWWVPSSPPSSTVPWWERTTTPIPPWWQPPQGHPVVTDPSTTPPPPPFAAAQQDPCSPGTFYTSGPDEGFRISGGVPAAPHSHPWIAALFNGPKQFCGGSLIDPTHILTAAHCVAHMSQLDIQNLKVRLGAHNLLAVERSAVDVKVSRVVRHKDYDSRRLYNDVAMLTLSQPVVYTNEVRPVCLDSSGRKYNGEDVTVAGWGSMYEDGPQPRTLYKVTLRVVNQADCRTKYGPAAPGGIIESYVCAGTDGKDSCQGDSGGPLVKFVDGVWKQVGLVSWGIGCGKGHYPGIYSRINSFLSWIRRVQKAY